MPNRPDDTVRKAGNEGHEGGRENKYRPPKLAGYFSSSEDKETALRARTAYDKAWDKGYKNRHKNP